MAEAEWHNRHVAAARLGARGGCGRWARQPENEHQAIWLFGVDHKAIASAVNAILHSRL